MEFELHGTMIPNQFILSDKMLNLIKVIDLNLIKTLDFRDIEKNIAHI